MENFLPLFLPSINTHACTLIYMHICFELSVSIFHVSILCTQNFHLFFLSSVRISSAFFSFAGSSFFSMKSVPHCLF